MAKTSAQKDHYSMMLMSGEQNAQCAMFRLLNHLDKLNTARDILAAWMDNPITVNGDYTDQQHDILTAAVEIERALTELTHKLSAYGEEFIDSQTKTVESK